MKRLIIILMLAGNVALGQSETAYRFIDLGVGPYLKPDTNRIQIKVNGQWEALPYNPIYDTIPVILLCNWEDQTGMTFTSNGFVVLERMQFSNGYYPFSPPTSRQYDVYLDINRKPIPKNLIVWQYRKK